MSTIEVRFRVRDDGSVGKAVKEQAKESTQVLDKIKQAGKAVAGGLVVGLKDARKLLGEMGNDTKRFESAMKQAGVSVRDAKVLTQQLNKELNSSRKEALGIGQESSKFVKELKNGKIAAEVLVVAFERAKAALEEIQKLGKVKSLSESTKDAMELQEQFDKLQGKLDMFGDKAGFAQMRKGVEQASIATNIPQTKLIDAILSSEEAKTAGGKLLENNGALLKNIGRVAYGDYMKDDEVPDYVKASIVMSENLKLNPEQFKEVQGMTVAGERLGALPARDIYTKGGSVGAQLMRARQTSGPQAFKEMQSMLQAIGDSPGIDGNTKVAVNRAENAIAKLSDVKTGERFEETYGFHPYFKKGARKGQMRPLLEISEGIARAEKEGKLKLGKDEELAGAKSDAKHKPGMLDRFEVMKDMQAREGVYALVSGIERQKALLAVDADKGTGIIDRGFIGRMRSGEGRLQEIQRRDEAEHARQLGEKMPGIVATADVSSQMWAKHPWLTSGIGFAGDIADKVAGSKAKMLTESIMTAGIAKMTLDENPIDPRDAEVRDALLQQTQADRAGQARRDEELANKRNAMARTRYPNPEHDQQTHKPSDAQKPIINLFIESGMRATVTSGAAPTSKTAQGNPRTVTKAGQR